MKVVGIRKSVESPGSVCSPLNFCQLSHSSRIGTAKKNRSRYWLSITGWSGVAIRVNVATLSESVSPGRASSWKIGTRKPLSNVVLRPLDRSKVERGISARGISLNLCPLGWRVPVLVLAIDDRLKLVCTSDYGYVFGRDFAGVLVECSYSEQRVVLGVSVEVVSTVLRCRAEHSLRNGVVDCEERLNVGVSL